MNPPSAQELLESTLCLMQAMHIQVRDTFSVERNLDDFYVNGGKYGGPRQFQLHWIGNTQFASASAGKKYDIPGFHSIAYDNYEISVPVFYHQLGRHDPAIHEMVHFLQHQTIEEDNAYFRALPSDPERFRAYLAQRSELEAHLVQVAYIAQDSSGYMQSVLTEQQEQEVRQTLEASVHQNSENRLRFLLRCKELGLI